MKVLPDPFYYLANFHLVLDWISARYSDLLHDEESAWVDAFRALPQESRALLVRFVMRKGTLFRSQKLSYEEIGCIHEAARPLIEIGWVENRPLLNAEEICGLLTKPELASLLKDPGKAPSSSRKAELVEALRTRVTAPLPFDRLFPQSDECIYRLSDEVTSFCERLKLMFFGNPYQSWTEFVLADLGIYRYEQVQIDQQSRAFQSREDVDAYLLLNACRERFEIGEEAPDLILSELDDFSENHWLANKRMKFVYQVAYRYEQSGELDKALDLYRACSYPDARLRTIRVLEKLGNFHAAYDLAVAAQANPENDEEAQKLQRVMPRLVRKLGLPRLPAAAVVPFDEWNLHLPFPVGLSSVEEEVRRHLHRTEAPAFYVENCLINSLFGLLCWEAIFLAIPGAFFHPFHIGPADLHSTDFYQRRKPRFDACLSQLDSQEYKATILARFEEKAGIQSPFVFWGALSRELLDIAMGCVSPDHLRLWFLRILQDIRNNRSGFPDLIQFWPKEKRYRMIEVKGPGDRLQDNQVRLLRYAQNHGMPVAVCYVDWEQAAA
ncbi:VRR-NUC domain-containing protein [Paucimonas lemoignei]|uniref:phosphodiesterase I n=1 Tax=Paucimonas lemoignei TaxID=29443 RepID=A0A4R3I1B9_PAULE|nr:VRR-NUC domain-containing protein [Paucimonas lemoignei]TCS39322.1 VRR-NUC domain-containing protein [Paucimonas lemoignei]